MRMRVCLLTIGVGLLTLAAWAGDVNVLLDSADGSSAFRVLDSGSNAVLDVGSASAIRLGLSGPSEVDQQQTGYTTDFPVGIGATAWQSFTVGKKGRLSGIVVWISMYSGPVSGVLRLRQGEGGSGAILWSRTVAWDEYWKLVAVDGDLEVSVGDVLTIEIAGTVETVRPGYLSGNPYAGGRSSVATDKDLMFMTYVTAPVTNPSSISIPAGNLGIGVTPGAGSERLTVAGNAVVDGWVSATSFSGDGSGLTGIAGFPRSGILLSATCPNAGLESAGFLALSTNSGGAAWSVITNSAAWPGRTGFTCLEYDGRMWVMGGIALSGTAVNDVWSSIDGRIWVQATNAAAWSARYYYAGVVYDDKMWVMGGQVDGNNFLNDVWFSTNGAVWVQATNAAAWAVRSQFPALAYNNRMWVLGGYGGAGNDVWSSTDGAVWVQATGSAAWAARHRGAAVVHQGRMWVLGGVASSFTNDVWSSADGSNWVAATRTASWTARSGHVCLSYDGRMWVLGGFIGSFLNDVWTSPDGTSWTQATNAAAWSGRREGGGAVHAGRMWMLGGQDNGGYSGDVWATGNADKIGRFYLYEKQ